MIKVTKTGMTADLPKWISKSKGNAKKNETPALIIHSRDEDYILLSLSDFEDLYGRVL